jgi:hypothetical protein
MDLSSLKVGTNDVELVIPGIGETGLIISLRHESAPEVQKLNKEYQNRLMTDQRKGGHKRGTIIDWYKTEKPLVHIVGWRWTNPEFNLGGIQPQFSIEKARELLNGDGLLAYNLRGLIDDNFADEESFLGKSV